MRICIVGCGAVGSLFAANLATLDDVEVWAYDLYQAHVDAINANGLRLTGAGEVHRHGCARPAMPSELPPCEFGIVATKAMHAESAIAATAHAFADGAVASVMNGVGNEETLARHVARVIRGTTFPAGKLLEPGRRAVGREGRHDVRRRSSRSPARADEVERLADACTRGGMPTHAVADARPAQWRKVIFNAATQPDRGAHGPHARPRLRAARPARARQRPRRRGQGGRRRAGDRARRRPRGADRPCGPSPRSPTTTRPSMLQDVEARRPTEIDYLNGGIARFGRELGVPTPLNDAITALIKGVEALVDLSAELERRYANVRAAMAEHDLDALIVSGTEYTGFEGTVTYLSGFQIVHRYAYVVAAGRRRPVHRLPDRGALRRRARHGRARAGLRAASRARRSPSTRAAAGWKRIGVYGLDYIMTVRDYRGLEGLDLVPFDVEFDLARARQERRRARVGARLACASTSAASRSSSSTTRRARPPPR